MRDQNNIIEPFCIVTFSNNTQAHIADTYTPFNGMDGGVVKNRPVLEMVIGLIANLNRILSISIATRFLALPVLI